MALIDAHASEVAAAMLVAPSFLSGLSPAEVGIVKQRLETRANPDVAEAKAATLKALEQAESGWRAAMPSLCFTALHKKPRTELDLPAGNLSQLLDAGTFLAA